MRAVSNPISVGMVPEMKLSFIALERKKKVARVCQKGANQKNRKVQHCGEQVHQAKLGRDVASQIVRRQRAASSEGYRVGGFAKKRPKGRKINFTS